MENKAKKIMVLSHLPQRDDVADSIFCEELDKRGFIVWKYPLLGNIRSPIMLIKPDIIVFCEIRCEYTRDMVKQLHNWGVTIVQRRCEHGVSADTKLNDEHKRTTFSNWPYSEYIDLDLIWGQKFADMVVESGSVPKEKIAVVGGPMFDQYFIPPPVIPGKTKKTALFVGAFGCADRNPEYAIPEALPTDKIHGQDVMKDRTNRIRFADLIERFLGEFPDWEVHIKPHQGEGYDYWHSRFGARINNQIKLFPPEPAAVSLTRCDAIIHCGSTMAYEAHLLKRPALMFCGFTDDALISKISPKFNDADKLFSAFKKLELGKTNANLDVIKRLEDGYFGVADGKANQRAADAICKLVTRPTTIPNIWPKDEPRYITKDVFTDIIGCTCEACRNNYFVRGYRECFKCPWCGVANVRKTAPGGVV